MKMVRIQNKKILSGIISETEAYGGSDDPASHAFRKISERNKPMFGEVGYSYVYFTYGMHYCFNIVGKNKKSDAGAVLIRAIIPIEGINEMMANRKINEHKNISNGPAKLTQAMKISKSQNSVDLVNDSELFITKGVVPKKIVSAPRVGISAAIDKKWNFKMIS
jgi:DNA-3-methyladenine glycosylase